MYQGEIERIISQLTSNPINEITKKGIRAGNLISGSKMPWFFFVALIATQSQNGPQTSSATTHPTAGAKFANPMLAEEKLYGGFDNIGDSNSTSSRNALAAPAMVHEAQHTMG